MTKGIHCRRDINDSLTILSENTFHETDDMTNDGNS